MWLLAVTILSFKYMGAALVDISEPIVSDWKSDFPVSHSSTASDT